MERITSKSNRLIKDTKRLITSSKERREKRLFVLEGARLCFDVLNCVYALESVFVTEGALNKYNDEINLLCDRAENTYLITDEVAERLSDTESTQGIFAVCKMPEADSLLTGEKLIALDNVQDPANVGAIVRTAEALGIDGIITYNCCDLYNPKVLRASMGGVLRVKAYDVESLEDLLKNLNGYRIYSTVPDSTALDITKTDFSSKTVCVIGNEANGVEENIKRLSDALVTIPMRGRAESLNAGAAAAIVMWEMLR